VSEPSEDPTIEGPSPVASTGRRWRTGRWRTRVGVGVAVVILLGGGVGAGMALAGTGSTPTATDTVAAPRGHHARTAGGPRRAPDPARQAWARQYGQDHAVIPDLAPAASASPAQQAAATDLLVRTEQATAGWADPNAARAAGYDLPASLARAQRKHPRLATRMAAVDAGTAAPGTPMPMLHVANAAFRTDGKVLDPTAPETLMYGYTGHGAWTLMGVMYTANEAYPAAPPDPGGPITRWHYHPRHGGAGLMMHIFFVPGNDLAHAYALDMKGH
jgi:hypothetical protein